MGTGKTTFIKRYIKGKRSCVFDVNNEYKGLPDDNRKPVSRVTDLNHKAFIQLCLEKRDTCCVWEDATGFIEGRLSDDFRKALVSKRHTGNVNILVFHSVSSVPPRLIQLSDYVILFKTSDEVYQIEKKYPSLLKYFKSINRKPLFSFELIKL